MQQVDTDPPSLPVGTEVSAKYKGAFCEAKVSKVVRNIKVKVAYKQGLGSGIVSDDLIKVAPGQLRVGATVEVRHPDRKDFVEGTVTKIQDCSQYTVVFDDGDITTLRRTALCLKSGRHFNESETLDQLPLTHPEHFGNPVVGGRRGRRRGQLNDESSDDEDESDTKEVVNEKEEHIGKVVCVEMETKKKDKEKWFPGLILAPAAQANVRIRVKDEYLVRSFKDGRYYTVPKKETTEFTREAAAKQDGQAVQAALEYLDSSILPPHWDRESLFGLNNSSSEGDGELDSDSSDDEPREEKDRFVAQLYKYMDDRGTPLNKVPSIQNRDVDLYRLFRAVQKCGGYNRVTAKNQWKSIAIRLGFTPVTVSVTNLVKQAFKKFLQPYGEFNRKLGCSMLMTPRNSNRSKGRSLVRANSVASPKPVEVNKDTPNKPAIIPVVAPSSSSPLSSVSSCQNVIATPSAPITTITIPVSVATPSITEESENTSESSLDNAKNKRKVLVGKVKGLIEKYEEKTKDEGDVPLSKIKAAVDSSRPDDKDKEVVQKDISPSISSHPREASPPGTSAGNKKDIKIQKKQTLHSDDKRNKRKKDETVEKVETGDFIVELGDKLKVYYHEKKVTYEAKVIEISVQRGPPMYLVHYTGWNNRYDEWVPRERIAENITKGSKQRGRLSNISSTDKQPKENPSKPPSAASLNATGPPSGLGNTLSSTPNSTKVTTVSAKRGRGRSDSLPPRSTTPSSVASNSSRTKSPATAGPKRRPVRSLVNATRRTSANVSDISLQSESDTDSDEPVRRPTRGSKDICYKSGTLSGKVGIKNKSLSAGNSQTDTDDEDQEEGESPTAILRAKSSSSGNVNTKGRNYDLSQIRSELRGFQRLKSPTPSVEGDIVDVVDKVAEIKAETSIKDENIFDTKESCISESKKNVETHTVDSIAIKVEKKADIKDENVKSSTDLSSETESFCDDDSQSSGKTTTLENMTKKFQQKIKAGKQSSFEKLVCGKPTVERVPRVVEKIIQDSLAEKLQESLKTKPDTRTDENVERKAGETVVCKAVIEKKEDPKKGATETAETSHKTNTTNTNNQTRFVSTSNASNTKFSSVIVEKSVIATKKTDCNVGNNKKINTDTIDSQTKMTFKEIYKTESSAACSPSSSSSSSASSSTSVSSRSLPDMSKLDISGGSSTSSLYAMSNKETKLLTAMPEEASPDIYEFKDPEPFEFEMRKMPITSSNSSSATSTSALALVSVTNIPTISPRKQTQKVGIQNILNEKQQPTQSPIAALVNRKKRGSPMKEAGLDKSKLIKIDEKPSAVTDTKVMPIASTIPNAAKSSLTNQNKLLTSNTISSNQNQSITATVGKINEKPLHTSFDTLRKSSPSCNVNINALNEELAQTVQETTRALTDAFQVPNISPPEEVGVEGEENEKLLNISPLKHEPAKEKDMESLITPPRRNVQPSASALVVTPIQTATPPKPIIGSPFVETRKDLSNVFELSTSEGLASTSELKDNKFEFENAKKMLSATSGAFDLDPSKYENKPTSIADKLLKAISQKKEEDKQKIEPKNDKSEETKPTNDIVTTVNIINVTNNLAETRKVSIEPLNINTDIAGSTLNFLSGNNNLNIEKLSVIPSTSTSSLNKPTPLTSPEPKLGILESITIKNNDLTETIQKLECAIQRRTPVAGLSVTSTPTSSLAPNTFSEDSMDSTDSERRLVIEDVVEDMLSDTLKSPNSLQHFGVELKTLPITTTTTPSIATTSAITSTITNKLDNVVTKVNPINLAPQSAVESPIAVKVLQPNRQQVFTTTTVTLPITTKTISVSLANKIIENSAQLPNPSTLATSHNILQVAPQTGSSVQEGSTLEKREAQNEHKQKLDEANLSNTSERNEEIASSYSGLIGSRDNISVKVIETNPSSTTTTPAATTTPTNLKSSKQQKYQNAGNVVPIVVPDIPVSVVVASGAVPSVKAAAEAAAAAAVSKNQSLNNKPNSSQADSKIASTSSTVSPSTSIMSCKTNTAASSTARKIIEDNISHDMSANNSGLMDVKTMSKSSSEISFSPQLHSINANSGFYLDPHTELRPEDGVKPIIDNQHICHEIVDRFEAKDITGGIIMSNEELTSNFNVDANAADSINLLCEETIPGSPAPVFGGKEDILSTPLCAEHHSLTLEKDVKDYANNPNISRTAISSGNVNSSPNDSASQDESSEDIKKNLDIENEISPRKRRRTRKQSEMAITAEQQTKRRKQISCSKKIPAGSDSDDDDGVSQRSNVSSRHQFQQLQQSQTSIGTRPCPYNFLVQLDPNMGSEQSIAIILKQIQELRKTYNTIKGDLASIDRRRKKLRRREREKKQGQTQQQIKIA